MRIPETPSPVADHDRANDLADLVIVSRGVSDRRKPSDVRTGMPAAALLWSRPALLPAGNDSHRRRQACVRTAPCSWRPSMINLMRYRPFRTVDAALLFVLAAITCTTMAHAFTAPAAGDLGYDIYDIVVNKGVKGPLGFVAGVAAFLFGVSRLFSNIMIGIPTIVAAVCLIKADSILQTFGMLI
jgi:hypothetical protein